MGRNFDAAGTNCLSFAVSEKKAWKNLTAYCHEDPHLNCPILPATLSKSLMDIPVIICKHFPGDKYFDKMTEEDGLLWLTKMDILVKFVFFFLHPLSTVPFIILKTFKEIAGTVFLLPISTCVRLNPNKCGGDLNHPKLQALTEDVLIETIKLCPKAKIFFFGKKPNQYAVPAFLQRLEKEGFADRFSE